MNQFRPIPAALVSADPTREAPSLRDVLGFLRIHRRIIGWAVLLSAIASVAYALSARPLYTSEAKLLVDATRGQLTRSREDPGGGNLAIEVAEVETQLQIIRSQKIALMVVDALKLTEDPEFAGETGGGGMVVWFSQALRDWGWIEGPPIPRPPPLDERHRAADALMDRLRVARVGASYVVSVSFTSIDPIKAAAVTNTLTTSYITERLDAKFEAAQRVSNIDEEREREIRTRLISVATPSPDPSHPRRKIIVALSLVFGLAAGVGLALMRHALDATVRTPTDVARLGLVHLGTLPIVGFRRRGLKGLWDRLSRRRRKQPLPGMHFARDQPLSLYAQSLRRVKGAIQIAKRGEQGLRIGVLSAVMGEGKSTVASNLAELLDADSGRAVLIDADLRGKALTRAYRASPPRNPSLAFLDVHRLRAALEPPPAATETDDPTLTPERAAPASVPSGRVPPPPEPASEDVLASPRMQNLLDTLRSTFEFVVVDLPPSALVPDALILARHLDEIIVVTEWGVTSPDLLASVVSALGDNQHKVMGVVINKANIARLQDEGHKALAMTYPHAH